MVSITACPECSQDVTIPDGLPREASVRCPLCEAEFPLAEMVDSMREVVFAADVPELQLVELAPSRPEDESPLDVELLDDSADDAEDEADSDSLSDEQQESIQADAEPTEEPIEAEPLETEADGEEDEAEVADEADEEAIEEAPSDEADEADEPGDGDETSHAQDASTDAPLRVRCPCCEAEFPLDRLIVASTGDPLGEQAAGAIASDGSPASGPSFDFALQTDDSSGPTEGESPSLAVAKGKRRKKEKSLVREMCGVFVGGAAGLLIMYYGLNYFGGEQFDMAEIYLPGIQHTAKHKPDWWPDWLLIHTDAEDSRPNDRHDPDLEPTDLGNHGGLVWRLEIKYKPEAQASEPFLHSLVHSLALRACICHAQPKPLASNSVATTAAA